MTWSLILVVEIFYVWALISQDHFLNLGNFYTVLIVDYVSKQVKEVATRANDSKVVVDFIKYNIFVGSGKPTAMISNKGTHFCNTAIKAVF